MAGSQCSSTCSTKTLFEDLGSLCRFCFRNMTNYEPQIDIFTSVIGRDSIFEIIRNFFTITELKTHKQYLNGKWWTETFLEVVDFKISYEKRWFRCICATCLLIISEGIWIGNRIRSQKLEHLMTNATLDTMLRKCKLIATNGSTVDPERILPAWNPETRNNTDEFSNLREACTFCFQHKSKLLFDMFLSMIGDTSVVEVIRLCGITLKDQEIYSFVHLMKSQTTTILIAEDHWQITHEQDVPRKICLSCIMPIIKLKALIERIRMTNYAIPMAEITSKLSGSIEFNLPYNTLEDILYDCQLKTTGGLLIAPEQILDVLRDVEPRFDEYRKPRGSEMETIIEITEYTSVTTLTEEASSIFCDYCKEVLGNKSLEGHILMSIEENPVAAVALHKDILCKNCFRVILEKDAGAGEPTGNEWKSCSICKLRLYQNRLIGDNDLTFEEFFKKYYPFVQI